MSDQLVESEAEFVTDAEVIRRMMRLGIPRRAARTAIHGYDANPHSRFPKKLLHLGGRRHWPSIERYLKEASSSTMGASANHRGSHA